MNRFDWIRGIMGMGGGAKYDGASAAAILAQVNEGFDSIANTLRKFEAEVFTRFENVGEELKNYALTINGKIRAIEHRLEVLEDILFEPDPAIRQEKISAMRPPEADELPTFPFPLDRSKL